MSAIELDIDIFDGRLFELPVVWYDRQDEIITVTGYGAAFVVGGSRTSSPLILATHGAGVENLDTHFNIKVPPSETANHDFVEAPWEFIVWPTAASPTVDPTQLLFGRAFYHTTLLDLSTL